MAIIFELFQTLIDKIAELQRRVDRYRDQLAKNELLTRYVLIDPFLRLLGWDLEDPEQVRPEFSTQAGRPDYALLHGGERPLVFIGAKSLGKQEDLQQYISYCVAEGVKYFIATDGAKWEVYDTYALKPLPEKKIAEWDITKDEPGEVLRKAFILFRYSPLVSEASKPLTIQETKVIPKPPEKRGVSLSSIKPKQGSPMKFSEIVFPDGRRYMLKRWRDILLRTVEWLVETKRITSSNIPISAGQRSKRYLVNDKPTHSTGERFKDPKEVSGFYVECNYGIPDIFRYSKRLLLQFGVSTSDVFLV